MKKHLLSLILILCLAFTLTGFAADLYGTYDQRIKLTIDNTKIDATLTWIPITVLLTSTAGEEVFVEFDADADFDKVAFTKADGTTELYADCEKFDDSAQIGIYHVSRDGWEIASGSDTDFYMYYDNDASSNSTYISKSGGTAAQSVWDGNFKAVYHMHDAIFSAWDTQYEADVEPDSDGWTLSGTDYSSVSAGILTLNTSVDDSYECSYYKTPDIDFDAGFYLKTRVKASSDMAAADDALQFFIYDGTQNEQLIFYIRNGSIYYLDSGGWNSYAITTTDAYHIYEVYIKGPTFWIYVDGVQKVSSAVNPSEVTDQFKFGDPTNTRMCKAEIDYLYYALGVTDNPINVIFDSTSNNNDGTKKGSAEPVEATGKVGQGQDFDGSDDYLDCGNDNSIRLITTDISVFALVNGAGNYAGTKHAVSKTDFGTTQRMWWLAATNAAQTGRVSLYADDGSTIKKDYYTSMDIFDSTWHHYGFTFDDGTLKVYDQGAEDTSVTKTTDLELLSLWSSTANMLIGAALNSGSAAANMDAHIDEVRISDATRTAAWIKATYNSLWDSLLTYGSEEASAEDNTIFFGTNF